MTLRLTRRKIAGKYATPTKKKNQLCFTVIHPQTSMNNTNFQQSMNESCQINHPFLIPEGKDSRSNCSFFYNFWTNPNPCPIREISGRSTISIISTIIHNWCFVHFRQRRGVCLFALSLEYHARQSQTMYASSLPTCWC